jgi:hypothetical protein
MPNDFGFVGTAPLRTQSPLAKSVCAGGGVVTTRRRLTSDERLADEVEKILIGCGLFQIGDSDSGSRN